MSDLVWVDGGPSAQPIRRAAFASEEENRPRFQGRAPGLDYLSWNDKSCGQVCVFSRPEPDHTYDVTTSFVPGYMSITVVDRESGDVCAKYSNHIDNPNCTNALGALHYLYK